jgi:hypothetical protein
MLAAAAVCSPVALMSSSVSAAARPPIMAVWMPSPAHDTHAAQHNMEQLFSPCFRALLPLFLYINMVGNRHTMKQTAA